MHRDRVVMTAANLTWWTPPVVVVARFARSERPFTEEVPLPGTVGAG